MANTEELRPEDWSFLDHFTKTVAAAKTSQQEKVALQPVDGCPWVRLSGEAGTLEYAVNVYEWMEHEFGFGKHCIVCDEGWWSVEERTSIGGSELPRP